jgi:hypothetical protein
MSTHKQRIGLACTWLSLRAFLVAGFLFWAFARYVAPVCDTTFFPPKSSRWARLLGFVCAFAEGLICACAHAECPLPMSCLPHRAGHAREIMRITIHPSLPPFPSNCHHGVRPAEQAHTQHTAHSAHPPASGAIGSLQDHKFAHHRKIPTQAPLHCLHIPNQPVSEREHSVSRPQPSQSPIHKFTAPEKHKYSRTCLHEVDLLCHSTVRET